MNKIQKTKHPIDVRIYVHPIEITISEIIVSEIINYSCVLNARNMLS